MKIVVSLCPHTKAMKNKRIFCLLFIVSGVYPLCEGLYDNLKETF